MHYYKKVENGKIISVEAKSADIVSPHFVKATKVEYDNFIASLPSPSPLEPPRDLATDINDLKARIEKLEKKEA